MKMEDYIITIQALKFNERGNHMKKVLKKLLILIVLSIVLSQCIIPISYGYNWLEEEQQKAVALYTQKFIKEGNEKGLLIFTQNRYDRIKGYNFEITSNEYGQFDGRQNNGAPFSNMLAYDSASFIATMYKRTLYMELAANQNARDNIYTVDSFLEDANSKDESVKNFEYVGGKKEYTSDELYSMATSGTLIPGDLIIYRDGTHMFMYLGTNEDIQYEELKMTEAIVEITEDGSTSEILQDSDGSIEEGEKRTIPLPNPHYLVHASNSKENIAMYAIELLPYINRLNMKFFVIRPVASNGNAITSENEVDMDIIWPDASYSAYTKVGKDLVTGKDNEYYYMGMPDTAEYSIEKSGVNYDWLVRDVRELTSWSSGFIGLGFKVLLVGWTQIIEGFVSDTVQSVGDVQREVTQNVAGNEYAVATANILNIEDIVYNRVPLFDANIFNTSTIAGVPYSTRLDDEKLEELREKARNGDAKAQKELKEYYHSVLSTMQEPELTELEEKAFQGDEEAMEKLEEYRKQENVILVIRKNIANIYYLIRNIAIVGLLATLIYIGIRMALSSIAEAKSKYKKMLVNWCVSMLIVFMIHYIMIFVLMLNQSIIDALPNLNDGVSIYDTFRIMAYDKSFTKGWVGAITYLVLVVYMIKYVWIYIKRFFTLTILTITAPIVGIGYAIDKIKDNKAQSLTRWLNMYVFNVVIQLIHAVTYTVLMTVVYGLISNELTFGAAILTFVFVNFITKAPKIVQNIFNIRDRSLDTVLADFGAQMTGVASVIGLVKTQTKLYGTALRPLKKMGTAVADEVRYGKLKELDYNKFDEEQKERMSKLEEALKEKDASLYEYEVTESMKKERKMREKMERDIEAKIQADKKMRQAMMSAQKEYAKNMLEMGKSFAYSVAAIPATVMSPKAGIAMALNAKNAYSKAIQNAEKTQTEILGYDVDKFKGKFSNKKLAATIIGGPIIAGAMQNSKYQLEAVLKQSGEGGTHKNIVQAEIAYINKLTDKMNKIMEQKNKLLKEKRYNEQEKEKLNMQIEMISQLMPNSTLEMIGKDGKIKVQISEKIVREAIAKFEQERIAKGLSGNIGGTNMKEILEKVEEIANIKMTDQKMQDIELVLEAQVFKKVIREMNCSSYRPEEDSNNRYRDPRQEQLLKDADITDQKIENVIQKRVDIHNADRIETGQISKMSEELYKDIENNDILTDEQKKDIMEAIEGELTEKITKIQTEKSLADLTQNEYIKDEQFQMKVEFEAETQKKIEEIIGDMIKDNTKESNKILKDKLDTALTKTEIEKLMDSLTTEDLIKTISGNTQVEIPSQLLDLQESRQKLFDMQKKLNTVLPDNGYRTTNVNEIVEGIKKQL